MIIIMITEILNLKIFDKSINYLKSNNYQIVKLGQTFWKKNIILEKMKF